MGKVSLDNCREMHRRYEKYFMEKAGRNIRKSSCLRNNTDQNQTKKKTADSCDLLTHGADERN